MPDPLPPADADTHFRLVATADWQIGMVGGTYSPVAAKLLRDTRISTIGRVLEAAETVGAQAVLAAGDLFEFPDQPQDTAAAVASVLQDHRDVPIHVIPGNHDLYGPGTVWTKPQLKGVSHMTVHHEDGPVSLADGVTLWPLPVRSKHDVNPLHDRLPPVHDEPGVHVVMAHGHDIAYLPLDHEDCKLPIDSEIVVDKGYALLVLGHWHSFKRISERVVYPGTHEQTKFGEKDAGNIVIIDVPLDGSAPAYHVRSTGQLRWGHHTMDCTTRTLPDAVEEQVRELSEGVDFLELTLTGEIGLDDALDALPRARAAVEPMVKHLTWINETRVRIDLDAAIAERPLPQGLRQVQEGLLEQLQEAGDDRDAVDVLRAELEVLYEVARDVGATGTEVNR